MSPAGKSPQFVIDYHGLEYLATTTNNAVKALGLTMLAEGVIAVPHKVWEEFRNLMPDEASGLAPSLTKRFNNLVKYRAYAATLAGKANSGFRLNPYEGSDLDAGAVAECEELPLLTVSGPAALFYKKVMSQDILLIDGGQLEKYYKLN